MSKGRVEGGGQLPKDSAVVLYWDPPPKPLAPGEKREVGFTYGLGNVASGEGEGRLLLTVGGRLVRDGDFTLTALVSHPTPGEQLTLTLPAGVKLVGGGSEAQAVPPGTVGETSTVTWKLRAVRGGEYNLQVKSSNGQTQRQKVTIRSTGVFD
jgi:predicted secreted protein